MQELLQTSATALARAIRAREVSALEAVDAHLERIERVNPALNAVVVVCAERARAEARAADAALARGEVRGPLHGVPMTIKDSLDTAGVVSSGGTTGRAAFVPAEDASVVARLRAAGAILLGKTNTPELTMSFETDNLVYGRTNNPWDPARSPGGSSGGSAAAVAACATPFDIGSDTGGSIRQPSHFCGIVGLKPTSGRVPRTGHVVPFGGLGDFLTQLGPLARRVEDLELLLRLIAGPDGRDPAIAPAPLGDPRAVALRGLRVAFHADNGIATPTPETIGAVRNAAKALADAGARVEEARPPLLEETLPVFMGLLGLDGGGHFRRLLADAGTARVEPGFAQFLEALSRAPSGAEQLAATIARWDRFRVEMQRFLEQRDAILCPVNAEPALPHGAPQQKVAAFSYTISYNLTGQPVVVVRAGTSPEGLPIGVQLIAPPWREDVALALAFHLEQALGCFPRPNL